jgi:osmotically-inducible protein OsmY
MDQIGLRDDILEELAFQPSINAAHIGVAVDKDVVTLSGHVNSFVEKKAAIDATKRVKGVRAVADEIEVRYAYEKKTADDEIAKRIVNILAWDVEVPKNAVQAVVRDGWVSLSGKVEWNYQRRAAENAVHKLSGIRGITNEIVIEPRIHPEDVKKKIEAALKRHAEVEAGRIGVIVEEKGRVILEGKVDNWDERFAVENAAWSAPGVTSVVDHLKIG